MMSSSEGCWRWLSLALIICNYCADAAGNYTVYTLAETEAESSQAHETTTDSQLQEINETVMVAEFTSDFFTPQAGNDSVYAPAEEVRLSLAIGTTEDSQLTEISGTVIATKFTTDFSTYQTSEGNVYTLTGTEVKLNMATEATDSQPQEINKTDIATESITGFFTPQPGNDTVYTPAEEEVKISLAIETTANSQLTEISGTKYTTDFFTPQPGNDTVYTPAEEEVKISLAIETTANSQLTEISGTKYSTDFFTPQPGSVTGHILNETEVSLNMATGTTTDSQLTEINGTSTATKYTANFFTPQPGSVTAYIMNKTEGKLNVATGTTTDSQLQEINETVTATEFTTDFFTSQSAADTVHTPGETEVKLSLAMETVTTGDLELEPTTEDGFGRTITSDPIQETTESDLVEEFTENISIQESTIGSIIGDSLQESSIDGPYQENTEKLAEYGTCSIQKTKVSPCQYDPENRLALKNYTEENKGEVPGPVVRAKVSIHSKLLQSLAFSGHQVDSSLYITSLRDTKHTFHGYVVYRTEVPDRRNKEFQRLISNMNSSSAECKETEYLTVCYKAKIYWLFLHNCSQLFTADDSKIFLLIVSAFKNDANLPLLCQENTWVIKTTRLLLTSVYFNSVDDLYVYFLPRPYYDRCAKGPNKDSKKILIDFYDECHPLGGYASCHEKEKHFFIFPLDMRNSRNHSSITTARRNLQANMTNTAIPWFQPKTEKFRGLTYSTTELKINPIIPEKIPDYKESNYNKLLSIYHTAKVLFDAVLKEKTQCLRDIFDNKFSLWTEVSKKIQLVIGPMSDFAGLSPCSAFIYNEFRIEIVDSFRRRQITINKFWPTCWYNMLVLWNETENDNVALDWDYLPYKCKVQETSLFIFSIFITAVTILGNIITLFVLIVSGLVRKRAYMIISSLAVADLLMGIMPAAQAVYDQFLLINGTSTLYDFNECSVFSAFDILTSRQPIGFQQLRFERRGYPMVCSIIMTLSVTVSLFSLALLSIQRLRAVMRKKLRHYQVAIGICITWVLGICFAVSVNYRGDSWSFVGYFDPVTKLTMNMASAQTSLSSVMFYIQIFVFAITAFTIIVLTITTIKINSDNEQKSQSNLKIHCKNRQTNTSNVTKTLLYMLILFTVASIPPMIDVVADLANKSPVAHFFCWWFFMAGSSWNWALYSFRGKIFRQRIKDSLCYSQEEKKKKIMKYNKGVVNSYG